MKLKILSLAKQEKGTMDMPEQFSENIRPDLIKRAVLAAMANKRQPYGVNSYAGKKSVSKLSKRRQHYRGMYGKGISRTPRKIMSRSGTQMRWVGAFAPQTVGGRRSHPPKAEKIWKQKINRKERRKAIRSALSATVAKEIVRQRGHLLPESYPFIIDSKIESTKKTKELIETFNKLGFENELERTGRKIIRAGRGKIRGRKYKKVRGMLLVVSENCDAAKSAKNIPGLEVAEVRKLNAEILAPGTFPGRMAIFTEKAVEIIANERLFTDNQVKKEIRKEEAKKVGEKTEKPKKKIKKTAKNK